jgi:uracil-DNA glycosylase family 4
MSTLGTRAESNGRTREGLPVVPSATNLVVQNPIADSIVAKELPEIRARFAGLPEVHVAIDACEICHDRLGSCVRKIRGLDRGLGARIFIVGEGPGKIERSGGHAFSGQAGKTLMKWLVASGASETDPRRNVYLTSLTKCATTDRSVFDEMARECARHLEAQLRAIQPDLIITLGSRAYEFFRPNPVPYKDALCRLADLDDGLLFKRFGFEAKLLPWPHPSGRNLWLNSDANRKQLKESFEFLKPYLINS